MEETAPNFRMQCPKCGKSFPIDETYCEQCTAMLEPVEVPVSAQPETPPEQSAPLADLKKPASGPTGVSEEKMEDITIDALKADIENQFIFTLLLELDQLKIRLSRKEKMLEGLHEKQSGMAHMDYVAQTGRAESEIEELLKKTTRIEMTIENLEMNLTSNIEALQGTIGNLRRPSFSGRFTAEGRYYRMIASELKIKSVLLDILRGKLPRSYFRTKRMVRMIVLGASGILCTLLLTWYVTSRNYPQVPEPAALGRQTASARPAITEQDVRSLLEDIRMANLTKHLSLWESRYSKKYLELTGKKENIVEQWNKYNFVSLRYRIENLQVRGPEAEAVIVWDMELRPAAGGSSNRITSRLASAFVLENGVLRIASVKQDGR